MADMPEMADMPDVAGTAPSGDAVAALVEATARVAARDFPDLGFLDPGGVLELSVRTPGVSRIRLELPGRGWIHLVSVVVDADGLDGHEAVAARTTQATSSVGGPFRHAPRDESQILDPDNRTVAVHTGEQDRPWFEIAFDSPVDLNGLLLRNRPDRASARARGLQVLVQTSDGRWRTAYDGLLRERQLVHALEEGTAPETLAAGEAGGALLRLLSAVHVRDYQHCVKDLRALELPDDVDRLFKQVVSEHILRARHLEWTSHGIFRSFRFWSHREQRSYVAFAMEVVDALRGLSDSVCLGFGSVLAVVRDRALIPHDDDLDILIGFDPDRATTLAEGIALVREHLTAAGFTVSGHMMAHVWVSRKGRPHKLDVFVGLFEGDAIAWYPGKRGSLTRDMMFPAASRRLLGTDCAVPREPERYLEEVYGPGWTVPDPGFRHRWDGIGTYADIRE